MRHQPLGITDLSGFRVGFHFCEERIPDHPRINRRAGKRRRRPRRQIDRGDVFIAEARFFQCGNQQVVDVRSLVQAHALAFRSATRCGLPTVQAPQSLPFSGWRGVGKGRPDRLAPHGQRPEAHRRRGQIDTTDVQPLQHLRPGGEFDPAYGNACFSGSHPACRGTSSAKIFLLIADVDGFQRWPAGGREGGEDQQPGGAESVGLSVLLSGFA